MSIEIELNYRKPRDDERQIAFVSISGVNSQVYQFQVGNVPIELDTDELVQAHLESREDELHLFCLRKAWIGADISEFKIEGKTELGAFLDWIEAGHTNPDGEVIENHLYEGTHPPQFGWIESIENANGLEATKAAIIQMLREQI